MSGTVAAQAVPIAISPILTRLYTPSDFGTFALYFSLVVLLGSLMAGRYELAILIPKRDEHAKEIVRFAIVIAFVVSLLLFAGIGIGNDSIATLLKNNEIKPWLYILPINAFLISVVTILYYWFNRRKAYRLLAKTKVLQSATRGGISLFFGFLHQSYGLILGVIAGTIGNLVYSATKAKNNRLFGKPDIQKSIVLMKKFGDFPKFNILTTLIENLSGNIPVYFFSFFFGPIVVGYYALSQQIIRTPLGLIGVSFGDVFRQKASHDLRHYGECRAIFTLTLKKLLLLSAVPFLIFYVIAPTLFSLIFGSEWKVAGEYAQIMTPVFFLQFVSNPLSNMFIVAQKQKQDLILQIATFLTLTIGMTIGYYLTKDVIIVLYIFTCIYSIKYLTQLVLSYRFTQA